MSKDGGTIIYGWSVVEGKFLIEAERHAIWKSREGMYIDITPSTSGLSNILFIEEELEYSGQLIN